MSKRIEGFSVDSSQLKKLNRFFLQDNFKERIKEVSAINVTITQKPFQTEFNFPDIGLKKGMVLSKLENSGKHSLDNKNGEGFSKKYIFSGYDESKYQFLTLEGIANITSHSISTFYEKEIYPICSITFYFYTRSKQLLSKINNRLGEGERFIRITDKPEIEANRDYAIDRKSLLTEYVTNNSIIFIDGPMIGGNISGYSLALVSNLHKKNVLPIFFVKNSDSNLVVDYSKELNGGFNSDLHWSYNYLKSGERTDLFHYVDKKNPRNSKIFCYVKPFDYVTPQRIEFHPDTYDLYKDDFSKIFDLIYYLLIVHGDKANPQIRPIAIAEMYAREVMHTINPDSLLKSSSLIKTMDQSRFER